MSSSITKDKQPIEILVSTMNAISHTDIVENLRIGNGNCVIINQVTQPSRKLIEYHNNQITLKSFKEKGLSRSRNKAIALSSGDICVIADDDMYYEPNYQSVITEAYHRYADADIIIFHVDSESDRQRKKRMREGRVGPLKSFKVSSWQITFKRASIINKGIHFDEEFGTGSTYFCGEENIFLMDCLRLGLKIYYVPQKIATLKVSESTWDHSHTPRRYEVQGAVFYRMSPSWNFFIIWQYAIRKHKLYKHDMTFLQALHSMLHGARQYGIKKGDA